MQSEHLVKNLIYCSTFCVAFCSTSVFPQADVLKTLSEELSHSFDSLQDEEVPPYYLSYEVTSDENAGVSGLFGSIDSVESNSSAILSIDLRVGSYEFDNSRFIAGDGAPSPYGFSGAVVPVEATDALRTVLWFETESKYREAIKRFSRVKSSMKNQVGSTDRSHDFSTAPVVRHSAPSIELRTDLEDWSERIVRYTKPFAQAEHITSNTAFLIGRLVQRWFVNSEGTRIYDVTPSYRLFISASAKADDGMRLPLHKEYYVRELEDLPSDEEVLRDVDTMIETLARWSEAPLIGKYSGPAILSGRVTGLFFHDVIGRKLEAHRQRFDDDARAFKEKLGDQVLPQGISVTFDPTLKRFADQELKRYYKFDSQGVRGQEVVAIEDGVLKSFLMSRTPIEGFPNSNGHGRKALDNSIETGQSNLLVDIEDSYSPEELKRTLIKQLRDEDREFGLYVEDVEAALSFTVSGNPLTFTYLRPKIVYKIDQGGSQQMVRGGEFTDVSLALLNRIEAGDTELEVFDGIYPSQYAATTVSTIAPSVLIGQIEMQKSKWAHADPRILPSPVSLADAPTND